MDRNKLIKVIKGYVFTSIIFISTLYMVLSSNIEVDGSSLV